MNRNIKNYFIDFINFVLIWIILVFLIAIFVVGSKLEIINNIFRIMIPLAFFLMLLLIVWKLERSSLNKAKYANKMELTLYLSHYHKFFDKLIVFALPVLLILIAVIRGGVMVYDIIQAFVVLLVLFVWHSIMFKKV